MTDVPLIRNITVDNPNDGLEEALWWLKTTGISNDSRNGRVLQAPAPVITTYKTPQHRVMFSGLRDANPFFHLYESVWMLAGRNDVESVARYAKQMSAFSDDGQSLWGAYGWRWRSFFAFDQLKEIVTQLRQNSKTRRAVLSMWSPLDLKQADGKDVPCNTQVYFDATRGALDMTVCNRSNDAVWGCFGANVVHMSMLQEFVASAAGLPVGIYHQFSNNLHVYVDREDCRRLIRANGESWDVLYTAEDMYRTHGIKPFPLFAPDDDWQVWLEDAERVAEFPTAEHYGRSAFFKQVVAPLMMAHAEYKDGAYNRALNLISTCAAQDWRRAAHDWVQRRWLRSGERSNG